MLAALERGEDRVSANRNSRGPWVARIRTALRMWDPAVPPGDVAGVSCNVREVSEWTGHNSVAFTLTRYGGLFEDGSDEALDRLDALLSERPDRTNVRGSAP